MHPLNPFLRAFFRSSLPAQCVPVQNHILLVPTTEVLLTFRDRESNAPYSELATSEEFLSCHVLRLSGNGSVDAGSVREGKGKAKQYDMVNGWTVVIKDAYIYSNKGFKNLAQAQILNDVLWYNDRLDPQQWLVYYISKPLLGSPEPIKIAPALLPLRKQMSASQTAPSTAADSGKKDIKSFNDLLNAFPMIARQMQPGLERLFKEFAKAIEKPLPNRPSDASSDGFGQFQQGLDIHADPTVDSERQNGRQNGHVKMTAGADEALDTETTLRHALETIVTAAIDLFQLVDKQQLSLLGATTDLTGPLVERFIERYITEQVHDSILFPKICAIKQREDQELESRIRQMENLDISQVGIPISGGRQGKHELLLRLQKGVAEFRKLGVAGSPQEMANIILTTERTVAMVHANNGAQPSEQSSDQGTTLEKPSSVLMVNADTLVSLLLVVVIRSQVRHLQARLTYMRKFIFIDDVEGGEMGYALSTFEAVLSYLAKDSEGLRRASRKNRLLWEAAKDGRVNDLREILQPGQMNESKMDPAVGPGASEDITSTNLNTDLEALNLVGVNGSVYGRQKSNRRLEALPTPIRSLSTETVSFSIDGASTTSKKRVSMDMRSISSSSGNSFHSKTTTIDSRGSGIEGDTSIEKLSQTQDPSGESVLMMAVECRQPEVLRYLLSLPDYFPLDAVLEDSNNEGTTLLNAAVQLGDSEMIGIILDFMLQAENDGIITDYFGRQDNSGRTMAHYLFNARHLIDRLGQLLPWTVRDKNGQTPLFALCRSYDHPNYLEMVQSAMAAAKDSQVDGSALCLDDHVDNKGNTLLHIVNDTQLAQYILSECNCDVNATNDKKFTPLMVASKYGRIDMVRTLFADPRVDLSARELRGLTAVELAKDDEVRSRIDDLTLLSNPPDDDGRITAVVRSYLVDDGMIRLVVKSAAPSSQTTITVTTCRRSLSDFENLAKCLALEHPASWLPSVAGMRSPFQIPSRPSRAILRDTQMRLDSFLKLLLAHSTLSRHEMLWEFFLAPEIAPEMMFDRSRKKAAARAERVRDEYTPALDVREVETFVSHARDTMRGVNHATKSVIRRVNKLRVLEADLSDAHQLCSRALSTLAFVPTSHLSSFARLSSTLTRSESSAHTLLHADLTSQHSGVQATLSALSRPQALIASMTQASKAIDRHLATLRRSDRWPLGLLDDTRARLHTDAADRVENATRDLAALGSELRYAQQTVAAELAAWQDLHERMGRRALRDLARRMVVVERDRLEGMRRALRGLKDGGDGGRRG